MENTKWLFVALAVWATAGSSRGDTWADWLTVRPDAPLQAEFQPGWMMDAEEHSYYSKPENYVPDNLGYEGKLVFRLKAGAEAPLGPLKVHVSFSVAAPEEMNWPKEDNLPENFVPTVLPGAVPRRPVVEETWVLPSEYPLQVPLARPRNCCVPMSFRNSKPAALFGRYEVLDQSGREVCRGFLPASKLSESVRQLGGRANAEEALRMTEQRVGSFTQVDDLPDEMEAYRQVRHIRFTEALWEKMAGRETLLRRLLLTGVHITGETSLVERIRGSLGTGKDGRVLAGAADSENGCSQNELVLRDVELVSLTTVKGKDGKMRPGPKVSVLDNDAAVFEKDLDSYLIWTTGWMLAFAIGVIVVLAVVFIRVKGERRVAVWWALPVWALLCGIAVWAGGVLVLERRPCVDVTEYRLAMVNWPEMHCRAVATAMTFQPGRPVWELPRDAVVYDRRYENLDGWWLRDDVEKTTNSFRLRLPRQMTGYPLDLEAGWFEPTALPLVPEDGTKDSPGRWLVAVQDVDAVYVLVQGEWHDLGAMKDGERRDPLAAIKAKNNCLPGLPSDLNRELSRWQWSPPSPSRRKLHDPDLESPPPHHDWIVVALKRDVPPRVAPVWEQARTKGRVIWVMQCP